MKFTHVNILSHTDCKHVDSRISQELGLVRGCERMVGAAVGDDDGDADDAVARGVSRGEEVAADVHGERRPCSSHPGSARCVRSRQQSERAEPK